MGAVALISAETNFTWSAEDMNSQNDFHNNALVKLLPHLPGANELKRHWKILPRKNVSKWQSRTEWWMLKQPSPPSIPHPDHLQPADPVLYLHWSPGHNMISSSVRWLQRSIGLTPTPRQSGTLTSGRLKCLEGEIYEIIYDFSSLTRCRWNCSTFRRY